MRRVVHVGGRVIILFELPDELPGIGRPAAERAPAGGGRSVFVSFACRSALCRLCSVAMRSTMVLTLLVFCFYDLCLCSSCHWRSRTRQKWAHTPRTPIFFECAKGDQRGPKRGSIGFLFDHDINREKGTKKANQKGGPLTSREKPKVVCVFGSAIVKC